MIVQTRELDLYYGEFHALKNINITIQKNITALIGPSGCGKSTFLRTLNRMNDLIEGVKVSGEIIIDGVNIRTEKTDLVSLRKKVGMVFQRPNPFPLSIRENILFAPKISVQMIILLAGSGDILCRSLLYQTKIGEVQIFGAHLYRSKQF